MCSRRSEAGECRSPMSHRPASASRAPAALRPSRASKLMRHWQKLRGTRSTHCTDATRRRSVSVLFKQRSSANFASRGPLRVRLGRADHLPGSVIRGRCSPVSGPIRGGRIGAALGQFRTSLPPLPHNAQVGGRSHAVLLSRRSSAFAAGHANRQVTPEGV